MMFNGNDSVALRYLAEAGVHHTAIVVRFGGGCTVCGILRTVHTGLA